MSNNISTETAEKIVRLSGLIAHNFLTVLLSKKTLDSLAEFYPDVDPLLLSKEWLTLQIFLMIIAISSYYKDDPNGIEISKTFRKFIIEGFIEAGVFDSDTDAVDFIRPRLEKYNDVTSSQENYILQISILFLSYIQIKDATLLINTGEQIVATLKSSLILVKEAVNDN